MGERGTRITKQDLQQRYSALIELCELAEMEPKLVENYRRTYSPGRSVSNVHKVSQYVFAANVVARFCLQQGKREQALALLGVVRNGVT